MLPGVSRTAAG